jgi:hypothetical protein
MRRLLLGLGRLLGQPRVIFDRAGGSPYLSRWYILGRPYMADGSSPIDRFGNPKPEAVFPRGLGVYLHRFHRSDDDFALHNHPWAWARALILAGGYSEERRESDHRTVRRHLRLPRDVVRIDADDFHRVDLLEEDSWSLFIAGPKSSSWGFWDRRTLEYVGWREFIGRIRGSAWDGSKP